MPSRSSGARTRRAVLAVVVVGALASIATSKVKQYSEATLPPTALTAGGPPAELQIRVVANQVRETASLTTDVRVDGAVAAGAVRLRFDLLRPDGTAHEVYVSEVAPGHWRLHSHAWRGCAALSCVEELRLRIHADYVAYDAPSTITVSGTLEVGLAADRVEGPIQIAITPAP